MGYTFSLTKWGSAHGSFYVEPNIKERHGYLQTHPKGHRPVAFINCFIETAKINVLKRWPYTDTVETLEELLPWNFKKSKFEKVRALLIKRLPKDKRLKLTVKWSDWLPVGV